MSDPWASKVTITNASTFYPTTDSLKGLGLTKSLVQFAEMSKVPEYTFPENTQDEKYEAMKEEIKNLPVEPWMRNLALATPVFFEHHLVRQQILKKGKWGSQTWKIWERTPAGERKAGYIMAARTMSDGRIDYDSDYGTTFCGMRYFMGYTVVTGLRSKPYFVLPQDITLTEDDGLDPL